MKQGCLDSSFTLIGENGLVGEGLELVAITLVELVLELDPGCLFFKNQKAAQVGETEERGKAHQWRRRA